MGGVKKCCVPGCEDKTSPRHRFPVYEKDIYETWLKRIQNNKIALMHPMQVYNTFRICESHFIPSCRMEASKRLKPYSLPALHLPGFCEEPSEKNSILNPYGPLIEPESGTTLLKEKPEFESSSSSSQISVPVAQSDSLDMSCEVSNTFGLVTNKSQQSGELPTSTSIEPTGGPSTSFSLCDATATCDPTGSRNVPEGILRAVNTTRQNQLTPKARHMYKAALRLKRQASILKKKNSSFRKRLRVAEEMSNLDHFQEWGKDVDNVTHKFLISQLRNKPFKAKGRRFTLDDKILALSLFKQSGKGYRLLSKVFALPSRRTMMRLLSKVPFSPGLNTKIMNNLRQRVSKLSEIDKYCSLIFDEMAIEPHLKYSVSADKITGFEDFGGNDSKSVFADHAIVFMVRGLRRKWKQPVAYMFCENTTKTFKLVSIIKEVIRSVRATGLNVVATICDQGSSNQAAINALLEETRITCLRDGEEHRYVGFLVDKEEIIPLYDPPHLLKGVRNNLLTKDAQFIWKSGRQIASWLHVRQFYDLDYGDEDIRMCPKLTDEHVIPEKIKKMKVSCCAQVFSQRLSSLMRRIAIDGRYSIELELGAADTADFLLFMDKLFDSVNGSAIYPQSGKPLRCAVSHSSIHVDFWNEAIKVLASIKFIDSKGNQTVPPSIKNWISTLHGFKYLWENLHESGFKFLCPRNLNQDPVENFFCCIRSQGVRNNNPSCFSFAASFKSLVVNNFMSSHSVGANCEKDETEGALATLRDLIEEDNDESDLILTIPEKLPTMAHEKTIERPGPTNKAFIASAVQAYIAGYLIKQISKITKGCTVCHKELATTEERSEHTFISARSYSSKRLRYPNTQFSTTLSKVIEIVSKDLPYVCHRKGVARLISDKIYNLVDMTFMKCNKHNLRNVFVTCSLRLIIHTWCNNINKILSGKDVVRLRSSGISFIDPIKSLAYKKYLKHRQRKM